MNKLLKKISVVLLFAMIISLLPMGNVANAAKMKQTGSSWLYEGQKQKITLRINFKSIKAKKVKWSSSNKKVATVNKKGVATAKKKGTAKIIMKYKGKKYYHKLTVKRRNNNSVQVVNPTPTPIPSNELAMNIAARVDKVASGQLLYTVTNNNSIAVSNVKISAMFYDAMGMPVTTDTTTFYDIQAGATLYKTLFLTSANLAKIDMTKTQLSVSVTNYSTGKVYVTDSVQITGNLGEDNKLFLTFVNSHSQKVYVDGVIFYRDAANNIVALNDFFVGVEAGATSFTDYSSPYYKVVLEGVYDTLDKVPFVTVDWVYRAHSY